MKKQAWKDVSSTSGERNAPSAGLTPRDAPGKPRERVTEYLWEAQPVKYVSVSVLGEFGTNSQRVEQKKREREFGSELSESGEGMILLLGFSVLAHQRWQECGINSRRLAMWHMGALCTVFAANLELASKKAYFKMMTLLPIPSTPYPSLHGAALAPSSGSR